jgi:hypothetical protein
LINRPIHVRGVLNLGHGGRNACGTDPRVCGSVAKLEHTRARRRPRLNVAESMGTVAASDNENKRDRRDYDVSDTDAEPPR